jgi:leader peptidase (prepilin peptidase)/N-methyltransferase
VTFIDFERQEIPDEISIPGIPIGFVIVLIFPGLMQKDRLGAVIDSALGILAGGGILFAIGYFGEIILKKEAMGGGDIKLLAMIGAFVGVEKVFLTLMLASFIGGIPALIAKYRYGQEAIPFGPYLCLGAFASVMWGGNIMEYLTNLYTIPNF